MYGAEKTACGKEKASNLKYICTNHNTRLCLHFTLGGPVFFPWHFPSGLNTSLPRLEVELETEQVWLWEKQVNNFTASAEMLSARGGLNPCCSSKQDCSQYRAGTAEALSHYVWASFWSWSVMSSLNSLFHSALACLWDQKVAICYGQHTSWTREGCMRCRQMHEEKQTNMQPSAAES